MMWLKIACVMFITALACELGLLLLKQEYWTIAPIWPTVGVSLAAFRLFGARAWPPLVLGHCWALFRINPAELWILWLFPLIYPLEAWLAHSLCNWLRRFVPRTGDLSIRGMLCSGFVSPVAVALPMTFLLACLLYFPWQFAGVPPESSAGAVTFLKIWVLIFMSHTLSMVTIAPLLTSLLRGEVSKLGAIDRRGHPAGLVLALLGISLLTLAFGGLLPNNISDEALSMIPLPFLFVGAFWLNRVQTNVVCMVFCVLALYLTGLGGAPFGGGARMDNGHIEIAFYILFVILGVQTLSTAGSIHGRRLRQQNLAMESASMASWYWSRDGGFVWNHELADETLDEANSAALPDPARFLPEGGAIPDRWHVRFTEGGDALVVIWDVFGRVISRGVDESPEEIIGLIKDATQEVEAERMNLALDHQRALMKGLQESLNPHFLFNTLNVIRALVHIDVAKAERAVLALSHMLRITLRSSGRETIPLADEIANIQALLEIASIRFENRISHDIDVPGHLGMHEVPAMLLFNLVEDVVSNVIACREDEGFLRLSAKDIDECLRVVVEYAGDPAGSAAGVRPAINDARHRLNLIFGNGERLDIQHGPSDTRRLVITFPQSFYQPS